jgi:hypothetical protein
VAAHTENRGGRPGAGRISERVQSREGEATVGRPKKKIDPEQVKALATIGCTRREVASMLGCDEGTIRNRFSAVFELGESCGKTQLRRKQHKRAVEDESDAMLMHLGKHRLGQHDRTKTAIEHTGEIKVIVEYTDDGDPDPAAPADSGDMSFSSVGAWNGDAASRDNEPFPAPP